MSFLNFEIEQESRDEFSKLLEQSGNIKKGVLMSAVVTRKDEHYVFVDVGLKSVGRIPKEEFSISTDAVLPEIGENITVLLEALEDKNGDVLLSYTKAIREAGWGQLEEIFHKRQTVIGTVVRKVQGGCIVNISGVSAFLPKSHFPMNTKDVKELFGKQNQCFIIKMDRAKSNIVVSLKNSSENEETANFAEGQIVKGTVKSIADNVAFIDLGGVTGRLHISEMSWNKIKDPSEAVKIGETIEVKIMSMPHNNRISLSLRELLENPWSSNVKSANLEVDKVLEVEVKSIEEKGVMVEIVSGIEGRLKLADTAWMKRYQGFEKFKKGDKLTVKIMEIDEKKNRINVSLKHAGKNSVEEFAQKHNVGDEIDAEIIKISDLGYVAKIGEQLDGIIPKTDAYVSGTLKIGSQLKVFVWNISVDNGHIVLGVKKP